MTSEFPGSFVRLVAAAALLAAVGCGETSDNGEANIDESTDPSKCPLVVGGHCINDVIVDECGLDTGYDGDVMCIKPPAPEDGFQMHIGPSEYTQEGMKDFLLPPGVEDVLCVYGTTPNETRKLWYESIVHMRPVSHHLIVLGISANDVPAGYNGGWTSNCGGGFNDAIAGLPGAQKVRTVTPTGGVYPPEYADVGNILPGNMSYRMELHFLNTTDTDLLRETWQNLYYKPQQEVKRTITALTLLGSVALTTRPGAHVVNTNRLDVTGDMKLVSIFGHYHSHATRFTIWRERAGQRELIYEDFDWFDPTTFAYNSITQNPEPDRVLLKSGAFSGILELQNDDALYWECEVVNDSDVSLRFTDEAIEGEMCNIFGEGIGAARFGGQARTSYSPGREIPIDEYNAMQ